MMGALKAFNSPVSGLFNCVGYYHHRAGVGKSDDGGRALSGVRWNVVKAAWSVCRAI